MEKFTSVHIEHISKIILNKNIDVVFPLFTPVEEKKWADDWNPKIIYPENDEIIKGTIFKHHHKEDGFSYWVIADYECENHYIKYINFVENKRIGIIEIKCSPLEGERTSAKIKYILTSIGEEGNEFINTFNEEYYNNYINEWEELINSYLRTQI